MPYTWMTYGTLSVGLGSVAAVSCLAGTFLLSSLFFLLLMAISVGLYGAGGGEPV